jgi:hypothetical protein
MASTYSDLKIELIGTGEQTGTWGTTTNDNFSIAIGEAITGSADVAFSSADVTVTLTNTNASQAARNLRLNLTGTSGGARQLILGSGCQIDKLYLINNGLADAVTVKNTSGTGIAVPAGKTMFVYNNGTNVVDAITYLSAIGTGVFDAGTVSAPSITFTGDTNTGIYSPAADTIGFTEGGVEGLRLNSNGQTSTSIAGTASLPSFTRTGDENTGIFFPAADTIAFTEGGVESMRIDSSGNVGIGVTPTAKLDVNGLVQIRGTGGEGGEIQLLNAANNAVATIIDVDASNNLRINNGLATSTAFLTNNTTRMTIASNGFVTTSNIVGINGGATASDYALSITGSSGINGGLVVFDSTLAFSTILLQNTTAGYLGTRGSYPLVFQTNNAERMRIDSGGNVGIGTSSPGAKLNVDGGAGNSKVKLSNTLSGNGSGDGFDLDFTGTDIYITNRENGFMAFENNGAERMRIDASGNLGVGTSGSSARIAAQVSSGIGYIAYKSTTGGFTAYQLYTANENVVGTIGVTSTNDTFYLGYTSTPVLTWNGSGNVGIGGSNDAAYGTFQVLGSSYQALSVKSTDASGVNVVLASNSSTDARLNVTSNHPLAMYTNNTERMRIDTAGNVIIGATSSAQKFKVYLNSSAEGNGTTAGFTQDGAGDAAIAFLIGAATEWLCGVDNSDSDKFKINNITGGGNFTNTGLNITTGGNVSISGSLSKGSGSFRIDHPLPQLTETHQLVHSFVEAPKADLIYRGRVTLVNGKAIVNIDEIATMTEGTFEVLCCDVQCFTTNESDWTPVRGSVTGNILTIESQDATAKSEISWMVIGERKDKHMMDTDWTDENGKVIVEPLKETTN